MREAAIRALKKQGPKHYRELAKEIVGQIESSGATPEYSLNAVMSSDIKANGDKSTFVRVSPGYYGLRAKNAVEQDSTGERIKVPHFPEYAQVRELLRIWNGVSTDDIKAMADEINKLTGTPQNPTNWTEPSEWIPTLPDSVRGLAERIWSESGGESIPGMCMDIDY